MNTVTTCRNCGTTLNRAFGKNKDLCRACAIALNDFKDSKPRVEFACARCGKMTTIHCGKTKDLCPACAQHDKEQANSFICTKCGKLKYRRMDPDVDICTACADAKIICAKCGRKVKKAFGPEKNLCKGCGWTITEEIRTNMSIASAAAVGKREEVYMSRYGVKNPSQLAEVKEAKRQSYQEHYGVDNPMKDPGIAKKIGKEIHDSALERLANLDAQYPGYRRMRPLIDEYDGLAYMVPNVEKYRFGDGILKGWYLKNEDYARAEQWLKAVAAQIDSKASLSSYAEFVISSYIDNLCHKKYEIRHNDRSLIRSPKTNVPMELDIYLPEVNLAIEYNGIYWHRNDWESERPKNKYLMCKQKGIRLISINEVKWNDKNKQDAYKSIISDALGIYSNTYDATSLVCCEISLDVLNKFVVENSLDSRTEMCSKSFGLFTIDGSLVQVAGFCASRNKNADYELIRFCTKKFTKVKAGLPRFLNAFGSNSVIYYLDLLTGSTEDLKEAGFEEIGTAPPSYVYANDELVQVGRATAESREFLLKLKNFSEEKSPAENLASNRFYPVPNAGSLIYKYSGK